MVDQVIKTTTAVFAGSFDPIHNGHLNIIKRAADIFYKLYVVVAVNDSKKYIFDQYTRKNIIDDCFLPDNVEVYIYNGLIINFCRDHDADCIVRGIRNNNDVEYETTMAFYNSKLTEFSSKKIDTLFLPCDNKYIHISSSSIKELTRLNIDCKDYVPDSAYRALQRYKEEVRKNNIKSMQIGGG